MRVDELARSKVEGSFRKLKTSLRQFEVNEVKTVTLTLSMSMKRRYIDKQTQLPYPTMAELPSKSRPAARKRGGRARGQMAGGMLASLSASAKPKATTTTSHAHNAMPSSLMHLNQDDDNNDNDKVIEQPKKEKKVAAAAPRRIPLKEESMNSTMGRQEIPTKAGNNTLANKKTANVATEVEATTKRSDVAPLSTPDIMTITSPRNDNPEAMQQNVVKSPYSILSPVAKNDEEDDDDMLTTPPLTSVKMKNQLHSCVLSPISLVGLSTPAKMEDINGDDEDTDDDDESFAESKEEDNDDDDSLEQHSNSSNCSSNESDKSSNSSHTTTTSSISNEEIAANPRSVIQRKIAKDFYGKTYVGTITGYDDSEKPVFWQVEYTDGDGEDYSYGELMQGMAYFEEKFGKDGVKLPSNYSPEESSCDYEDDEDNDEDECFDDDETDDDEDYSIEQDSDSEDELEIDEGVDSEKKQRKNGKSRGKKGTGKKVPPANDDIKSGTMSGDKSSNSADQKDLVVMLEACRVDLSTQLDDDDEVEEDNMNVDFNVSDSENSPDHITTDSDSVETEDSDPVAVEVLSEDGTSTGVNSASWHGPALKESTSVEMQASQDAIDERTMEEAAIEAKSPTTNEIPRETEPTFNKPYTVEAMVEPQGQTILADEGKIEVEADVAEGANDPQQPTISELFAAVDKIFIESDTDTVTVKDVKNSVADHFGLEKVSKEIKKAIRDRLTDLIQGNVHPAGAMEETASENHEEKQEDAMTEAVETNPGDSSNIVCDESSPVESSGAISHSGRDSLEMSCFAHDGSLANESQSNSVSTNDDQMAMSGTLFQNLSPEFSIYSRSSVNDEHYKDEHDFVQAQMKSISSPYKANKPKSRSVVVKGKWSLGPEIGIGSFGRVHTGLNTLNGSELDFESFAAWLI